MLIYIFLHEKNKGTKEEKKKIVEYPEKFTWIPLAQFLQIGDCGLARACRSWRLRKFLPWQKNFSSFVISFLSQIVLLGFTILFSKSFIFENDMIFAIRFWDLFVSYSSRPHFFNLQHIEDWESRFSIFSK